MGESPRTTIRDVTLAQASENVSDYDVVDALLWTIERDIRAGSLNGPDGLVDFATYKEVGL
jgi:hypothetical protein